VDIVAAQQFLSSHHRAVLTTFRRDGRPQISPVLCGVDAEGRVIVSSTEDRAKVRNLRRDPRVAACVITERFFGAWVAVEGTAEVVPLPEAMEGLVEYYRLLSGEHPNWDEYREAMRTEQRVLIRFAIEKAAGTSG
jgi:PPOX class probable F420-dependent enzyme